jgi:GNAT superfamily N-acetyltransferase
VTSSFHVRPVRARDEWAWRLLWREYCDFYGVSVSPEVTDELWRRIMDRHTPVSALVAEAGPAEAGDARLVGIANYVLHPYTWGTELICYLEDLFVAEQDRGKGAGKALIGALIRLSEKNGWPRLYWHTHEDNKTARSLYDRITPVDRFVRYTVKLK